MWNYENGANIFGTNNTERMRIDSSGNVGIGTSSPTTTLDVSGTASLGTDQTDFIKVIGGGGTARIDAVGGNTNVNLSFATKGTGTTYFWRGGYGGTESMRIDGSGNVGIGTTTPITPLQVNRDISGVTDALSLRANSNVTNEYIGLNFAKATWGKMAGIYGRNENNGNANGRLSFFTNNSGSFLERLTIQANGNSTFSNNLTVNGTLSKASGSFKIDHPLPEKTNTHHLVHSFVESPQADNIYRGKINLVNGTATVNIDTVSGMTEGTFVLLNRDIQCFTSNETGWTAVKGSVSGNTLTITAQDNTCTDTISWMVIGERQDQHMIDTDWTDENGKVIVEPLKETEE
jgi:hypothetical protein